MTEFKSPENTIHASAKQVFDKLSDLSNLREFLKNIPEEKIPADKREMFDSLQIEPDSITIQGGPTGAVKMEVTERVEPELIRLKAAEMPIDVSLMLKIAPVSPEECKTQVVMEADIPFFLKGMVAGPMQQVVDQFAEVLGAIKF